MPDVTLFLCGDVMTGRGIDQILRHPCEPRLHESYLADANDYVRLAEGVSGPIPRSVDDAHIWGDALDEFARMRPDMRIVNLETAVTQSEDWLPKGINYRMHPANVGCLEAAAIDCCVLANNHVLDWSAPACSRRSIRCTRPACALRAPGGIATKRRRRPTCRWERALES